MNPEYWLQLEDEPLEDYAIFSDWLAQPPPRSVTEWAMSRYRTRRGGTAPDIWRLSQRWLWHARAEAWDTHLGEMQRAGIADAIRSMARNRAEIIAGTQAIGASHIRRLLKATLAAELDDRELLAPEVALRYAQRGLELERDIGMPKAAPEAPEGRLDMALLTPQERRLFGDLARKAKRK